MGRGGCLGPVAGVSHFLSRKYGHPAAPSCHGQRGAQSFFSWLFFKPGKSLTLTHRHSSAKVAKSSIQKLGNASIKLACVTLI